MALTLSEELRRTFDRVALRHEAHGIQSPHQWRRADDLMQRCDKAVAREEHLFRTNYATRVEVARRRIINEAGAPKRTLRHPWAIHDRFSPADTLRQAEREVRAAHHARLDKIRDFEARELGKIVKQSMRENNLRGDLRLAFRRSTNRRSGKDRRKGPAR
ncbi:hypothetical protein GGD81_004195 [Rhodobium orientis]|uniref:Uncharacterized protein n=1 Tax=Rhodobium orientis TaxID=34017 RepID=A0A327JL03_9HYPH|nr:hypothetical protein [Rhodobium orientis]MBB4305127.1 hypothetical protein [Rhodobium orientis]MBK5950902.1 hypothetical protein [Rhodobium orientis]RAI27019.1 hypothetical protein CH339_11795 [Rhodobium orientis]